MVLRDYTNVSAGEYHIQRRRETVVGREGRDGWKGCSLRSAWCQAIMLSIDLGLSCVISFYSITNGFFTNHSRSHSDTDHYH